MQEQSTAISNNAKSVQGTDKCPASVSKFTPRYWMGRIFLAEFTDASGQKVSAGEYRAKIQLGGRRVNIGLRTSNKRDAAELAANLYSSIRQKGWDFALAQFDPTRRSATTGVATLGEVVAAIKSAELRERTSQNYVSSLRWWAARALEMKAAKSTFGPQGSEEWRARIDGLPVSTFNPERVASLIARHLSSAGSDAQKLRSAKISVSSFLRNARAAIKKAADNGVTFPAPLPFAGVKAPSARPPSYVPVFNAKELLQAARTEFRNADRSAWFAILLAIGSGLRRGELANLKWKDVRTDIGSIIVAAGGPWSPKTVESEAPVYVDPTLLSELEPFRGGANDFVLSPGLVAETDRCAYLFAKVVAWLRKRGVTGNKPIHALRKEFGSMVAQSADLFTASKQLRHSSMAVTALHYVENRKRTAPDIGAMLKPLSSAKANPGGNATGSQTDSAPLGADLKRATQNSRSTEESPDNEVFK